jgi:hypothetical protein
LDRLFGDAETRCPNIVSTVSSVHPALCVVIYFGMLMMLVFMGPADQLVPPLFGLIRGSHLPTTLRTSSLSLLATIADTTDIALLPYAHDLTNAMLDLLQIEGAHASVQAQRTYSPSSTDANPSSGSQPTTPPLASMDSQPTAADTKFPPFRRASLHFLGVLVRAYTRRAYSSLDHSASVGGATPAGDFPTRRATTTLGYVAATDPDAVVRVMAREVVDAVHALERGLVGL